MGFREGGAEANPWGDGRKTLWGRLGLEGYEREARAQWALGDIKVSDRWGLH